MNANCLRYSFVAILVASATIANSAPIHLQINPSDDGAIYSNYNIDRTSYVSVGRYIEGAIKFPTRDIRGKIAEAQLSINPYGLPVWITTLQLRGFQSARSTLDSWESSSSIGTWNLPPIGYGQDAYFNLTDFMCRVTEPYVGFRLAAVNWTQGGNQFSSLERNYGHPSQLLVTLIPEPASILLATIGLSGVITLKRMRPTGLKTETFYVASHITRSGAPPRQTAAQ